MLPDLWKVIDRSLLKLLFIIIILHDCASDVQKFFNNIFIQKFQPEITQNNLLLMVRIAANSANNKYPEKKKQKKWNESHLKFYAPIKTK
jgi:hypothetical protein